ncbi:hypothetical protein TELCIR_09094 [Teladorsagia circumcincta]|uniref:Uncharacterized protein n=1 Tax=Teladorsagia circumcincta TaxID=45464 RepID=A0A2G9UFS7_TELCI|nr:hypothetical protein TELCIR_09094 [Teladorsagia circumcincta]
MRRSILSSIMGLRRKPRPSTTTGRTAPGTPCSSSSLPRSVQPEIERTPHDIYREIVVECEQFERSGTSSPQSDFESSPTTPITPPLAPSPTSNLTLPTSSPLVASQYPFPLDTFAADPHSQPYAVMLPEGGLIGAPPPYTAMPLLPLEDVTGAFPQALLEPFLGEPALASQIKQEDNVVSNIATIPLLVGCYSKH